MLSHTVKALSLRYPSSDLEHRVHSSFFSVTFDGQPASFRTWHKTDSHHATHLLRRFSVLTKMHPTLAWRYVGMSVGVEQVSLIKGCDVAYSLLLSGMCIEKKKKQPSARQTLRGRLVFDRSSQGNGSLQPTTDERVAGEL